MSVKPNLDKLIDATEYLAILGMKPSHKNAEKAKAEAKKYNNPHAPTKIYRSSDAWAIIDSWRV